MDAPPAFVVTVSVRPYRAPLDVPRLAEAIRLAEATPNEHVGAAGERSSWQITPAVWREHSSAPHWWASSERMVCRAETRRVVLRHLDRLRVRLATARPSLPDTPFYVALAWAAGPTATLTGTASGAKLEYAARAQNCYEAAGRR